MRRSGPRRSGFAWTHHELEARLWEIAENLHRAELPGEIRFGDIMMDDESQSPDCRPAAEVKWIALRATLGTLAASGAVALLLGR